MQELSLQKGENNPILRSMSEEIQEISGYIKNLAKQLENHMFERDGVGLAAPQIGINLRIIATTQRKKDKLKSETIMINPTITEKSTKMTIEEEACLSLPKNIGKVKRYQSIKVTFTDIKGNQQSKKYKNLNAIIIQHEIDHLDGILFIDRIVQNNQKN